MYVPKHFEVTDPAAVEAFIRRNAFATLISIIEGEPFATHLPLILEGPPAAGGTLLGHVARANPHWQAFDGDQETLAVFQGPHAYVSPQWYENLPAVPTWNYAAVHVYGSASLMADDELASFVDRLTRVYEDGLAPGPPYKVPPEYRDGLIKGIVGFELKISRVEAKFKLSQNRPGVDQRNVIASMEAGGGAVEQALGALMREHLSR
jgi:transcriptional regulator